MNLLTAIVAVSNRKRTWLGADSALSDEHGGVFTIRDSKVKRSGGYAYGCSGESLFGDILDAVKFPEDPSDHWVRRVLPGLFRAEATKRGAADPLPDGEAIIGAEGSIWILESKLAVSAPLDRFAASGTATWVALGALYVTPSLDPRRRVLSALKAAARYDQAVRPPFRVVEA